MKVGLSKQKVSIAIAIMTICLCAITIIHKQYGNDIAGMLAVKKDTHEKYFSDDILEISKMNSGVHIVSRCNVGKWDEGKTKFSTNFVVKLHELFNGKPDRHAMVQYELVDIGSSSVTIKYHSSFDHSSFGVNKVSRDTGTFVIKYRN